MSWLVALKKIKLAVAIVCVSCFALLLSGCGRSIDDYTGTWMGIDESESNFSVYQCDIIASENGSDVVVRMTQYRYKLSNNNKIAIWTATDPHYFNAFLDRDGNLVSDIGVFQAKPSTFQLIYGDIFMTRRAKNTESKFRSIARDQLAKNYPELVFKD